MLIPEILLGADAPPSVQAEDSEVIEPDHDELGLKMEGMSRTLSLSLMRLRVKTLNNGVILCN